MLRKLSFLFFTFYFSTSFSYRTPMANNYGKSSSPAEKVMQSLEALKRVGKATCSPNPVKNPNHPVANEATRVANCLVCNCANEAGNQEIEGMEAVNRVVFSRVKKGKPRFEESVCGVIWQKAQFSWTIEIPRKIASGKAFPNMSHSTVTGKTFENCIESSKTAATKEVAENPKQTYSLFYHATYVKPKWASGCPVRDKIGAHIFYHNCDTKRGSPENTDPISDEAIAWILL